MRSNSNQNNQYTSITIEEQDPLENMNMNHSSSLLEDDNGKSFLMDDDNFLATTLGEDDIIPLASPESSQDTPATPPQELYNILHNITSQPTAQPPVQTVMSNDFPPFGVVNLHGTMFAQPPPMAYYGQVVPQVEYFPQMMAPADYSQYFSTQPQMLVQPPVIPLVQMPSPSKASPSPTPSSNGVESDEDDDLDSPRRNGEPPKKRRKRKCEEIDEDNYRLNTLCKKPNAQLTEEEKQEKRRLRNRQTAQRSRNNQKVRLDSLEKENGELKKKNSKLQSQLDEANRENALLKKEIKTLKDKNVIIDLPVPKPIIQPGLSNPQKATMLFAIVFCVGCTLLAGNMFEQKDVLTRIQSRRISEIPKAYTDIQGNSHDHYSEVFSKSSYTPDIVNSPTSTSASSHTADRGLSPTIAPSVAAETVARSPIIANTKTTIPISQDSGHQHRRDVGARTLQAKNDTEYCQMNDNMCNVVSDDEDVGSQPVQFNFDPVGMTRTNVFYPNKMRQHIEIRDHEEAERQKQKHNLHERAAAAAVDKVASQELTLARPKKISVDQNNKQLIRMTENSFFEKMREKRHKYSMGAIYQFPSPIEEESDDGKKTIHLFCPFIYPMLPNENGDESDTFSGFEGINDETRIKIHVPVQMLNRTTNNKIIRLAEITGENMSLSESYFELDAALAPTTSSDGTIKPESE